MKFIISPLVRQYALVITVNFSILTTGMSIGWPSPSLAKLMSPDETPLDRILTVEEGSWLVSLGYLIGVFSSIPGGMLIDKMGRKNTIVLISIPKVCATIILVFANKVWMFITCRTIMIVVDSLVLVVVPLYASEIASKEHRGSLGAFLQLSSAIGILFTMIIGVMSYKIFSIVYASVILVLYLPLLTLPETPFHLFSIGREDEAMAILKTVRNTDTIAKDEIEEYRISESTKEKIDKIALFKNRIFLKAFFLGICIGASCQLIGVNAVMFYIQTIMEAANTSVGPETASILIGVIQVGASFCTPVITHRFRRRIIFLSSLFGVFIGMICLGIFFKVTEVKGYDMNGIINYLPIASVVLIMTSYCLGVGSLLWVVASELFDGPARAIGCTFSVTAATLTVFISTKYFALMSAALGPAYTYWVFAAICMVFFVILGIFLPETKGKSFREIQIALGEK